MTVPGYRSLRFPAAPDRDLPDYDAQWARYWQQSDVWWDNWAHNFAVSMILLPVLTGLAVAAILIPFLT